MKRKEQTTNIRIQSQRSIHQEHSVPVYLTSSFTFNSAEEMEATFAGEREGIIYSRYSNPNTDEFIAKLCRMEGTAAGFATASGMAAVWASLAAFLRQGDHIISGRAVFGSTHQILTQILPKWGIDCTYVDGTSPEEWEAAVQPNTKMMLVETPSNPGLRLTDLEAAGNFAASHGLILNVDNCFATPILQKPLQYGAHLVVHSATKYIDGQGRVLGGVVLGSQELIEKVIFFCRHTGPAMSPFNAWVLSKSIETLALRMERHCSNAIQLAQFLESHEKIARVYYPFLNSHPQHQLAKSQMKWGGGIVSFELEGNIDTVRHFINHLEMISITSNLGDSRTIVTHPATTTHSKLSAAEKAAVGISENLIRISTGLEDVEDIIADINQALKKVSG